MQLTAALTLRSVSGASTVRLWLEKGIPYLSLAHGDRLVLARACILVQCGPMQQEIEVSEPVEHHGALQIDLAHGAVARVETFRQDEFRVLIRGPSASANPAPSVAESGSSVSLSVELDGLGPVFGLGHLMMQHWPLQDGCFELGPFYPFDNGPHGLCTMAVPTCVTSSGLAITCHEEGTSCLHVSLNASEDHTGSPDDALRWGVGVANFDRKILPALADGRAGDGRLTLQSRTEYDWPHVRHPWLVPATTDDDSTTNKTVIKMDSSNPPIANEVRSASIALTIGAEQHIRTATERFILQKLRDLYPNGRSVPPISMMRDPIWTTWAHYKDAVDQEKVLEYAQNVALERKLPHSIMEIDDRWSVKYGDLDFDLRKFPDPATMVARLHELGFLVTLWIIPFANLDSKAVTNPATRGFFVKDQSGDVGGFDWWQPTKVAALDVTNDDACDWFLSRLKNLQLEYGIDGFKFDAGEPCFLPPGCATFKPLKNPSDYTRAWINKIVGKFEVSECRAAVSGTEIAAPMLRLFDRFSTWGFENGLASVVTAMLTASVLGYPFVLPDMIGGNAYDGVEPDAELMIRWAQATAAMPSMQFSIPPWEHGGECERLCGAALQWRACVFWPVLDGLLAGAATRFEPIARPMWWAEPTRTDALRVADQFMLGDSMVVAPIVAHGARTRRAFLPTGRWQRVKLADTCSGTAAPGDSSGSLPLPLVPLACEDDMAVGPCWLDNVRAALDDMPVWIRATDEM